MQFRREQACETLLEASAALAANWRAIRADDRAEIESLIREFGRRLARQDPQNRVGDLLYILRGLAGLQDRLPAAVRVALRKGEGPATRNLVLVSDDEHARVLDALTRVVDARYYRFPATLARRASDLVRAHAETLTAHEFAAWQELEWVYVRSGDPVAYLDALLALLPHVDTLRSLLTGNRAWQPTRAGDPLPAPAAARPAQPAPQPRCATVHFPATILVTQRMVPLVVVVSRAAQPSDAGANASQFTPAHGDLLVHLTAEDMTLRSVIGGRSAAGDAGGRLLAVPPDADCEPLVFFLDPNAPGRKRIGLDIYQAGTSLVALRFETEIVEALLPEDRLPRVAVPDVRLTGTQAEIAPPPDLELRVMLLADGRTLSFVLHSHNGDYHFKPMGQVTLLGEPQTFFDTLLADLNWLARLPQAERGEDVTREALRRISAIGMRLYDELLPPDLKREYADVLRTRYAGKTLLITSDEPWIPWEIVRPFAVQGGRVLFSDPPLCENFRLARWLAGRGAPAVLHIARGAIVAPPSNLSAVRAELDYFTELRRRKWEVEWAGPLTRLADVVDQLEGGAAHLLHLSAHGNFDASDPRSSALKLADGYLRPVQLLGAAQAGIERAAPLVFLNACHAGQNGLLLTRIGGWAETFLGAGAGAFIGSLWEINDRLAAEFARVFYDGLFGSGEQPALPIAEAFHRARLAIKAADPANPTWLAYVLYAAPNLTVHLSS